MKITEIRESAETCSEAGWYAYDFYTEESLTDKDIVKMRPLGSFLYLSMLKNPFFKVEGDYFLIKGVRGDSHFRVAAHGEHMDFIERVKAFVEQT